VSGVGPRLTLQVSLAGAAGSGYQRGVPELLLGPVLRYVSDSEAVVWVETDEPCEVEVLDHRAHTFGVEGHHYALVCVHGLEPATTYEYGVSLDGESRWPESGSELPKSIIRTVDPRGRVDLIFGSCRVALPHHPPYTLTKDKDERGRGPDALHTLALSMLESEPDRWPELVLLLGDQVYADEVSPQAKEFILAKRDTTEAPAEEVADFEEYTRLYWEAWGDPVIRWLFSTVSIAMVFDDHDMHDDWNISRSWLEEMSQQSWWEERAVAGLMSYWIYQFIGNLSPRELEENSLYRRVREQEDAAPALRDYARKENQEREGKRWSYYRDLGSSRLIVVDSRIGRVLDEDRRDILDDEEWEWVEEKVRGDFDHLLIGTSDPFLLAPGLHYLEGWNEAVCSGAWGDGAARIAERIRRLVDSDHWPAFQRSFRRLTTLLTEVGSGRHGRPPATICILSGDVHHAYLAEVAFRRDANVSSAVYQAVCSPFRKALNFNERLAVRVGHARPMEVLIRALAHAGGVDAPDIRWRFAGGPYFDNQIATLSLKGREASLTISKTVGDPDAPQLETAFEQRIA
jgi:PhoD-like phosphatase